MGTSPIAIQQPILSEVEGYGANSSPKKGKTCLICQENLTPLRRCFFLLKIMPDIERLGGGFVNEVYRLNGQVFKYFPNDGLVRQSGEERARREKFALERFGGDLAPTLMGFDRRVLIEEFLEGQLLENSVRRLGLRAFEETGEVLRRIHSPVRRDFSYTRDEFESRVDKDTTNAGAILSHEGVASKINIDWNKVSELGTTRVHRDFWFGNIIVGNNHSNNHMRVIDWEFSGIGSPYEDFAIVDLWVLREYQRNYPGCDESFWKGYDFHPDGEAIKEFLKARCISFLATTTLDAYMRENDDGFYHNKVQVLKELT